MKDLVKRLDEAASTMKYAPESVDWEKHDTMLSLLREAAARVSLLESLVTPLTFSFKREDGYADVKLEGQLDLDDVSQFLEVIAENI